MRTMKTMGMSATLTLILIVPTSRAEDAKAIPSPEALIKLMAEAGKPGPEHQKLQSLVGDWNFTLRLWTDPSQSPAEARGTVERKWIFGGRFIQETVKGECHGKTFEAMGLVGYDSQQKKYSTVRVCGLCGKVSTGLSTLDAAGTKFTCATEECCPLTGEKVKGHDELVIESNDKIVLNVYKTIHGKELKVVEIVSTRK